MPIETDPDTSRRFASMPQGNTSIEKYIRRELFSMGLRFRTNNKDLPGPPDIANRRHSWAVFVHGCYWHHHEGCKRATIPKRNRSFWVEKFTVNRNRDQQSLAQLSNQGFVCTVFWECEIKDKPELEKKKLLDLVQKIKRKR